MNHLQGNFTIPAYPGVNATPVDMHPLGLGHTVSAPQTVANGRVGEGQIHMANGHPTENLGMVKLSLNCVDSVYYIGVHFYPNLPGFVHYAGVWETIDKAGSLQGAPYPWGAVQGPHPILNTLDRMFGLFGTGSLMDLAANGNLTYDLMGQILAGSWSVFQENMAQATDAGSITALPSPWTDPDHYISGTSMVEHFPATQQWSHTRDFEFAIGVTDMMEIKEAMPETAAIAAASFDNIKLPVQARTLRNSWVGNTEFRGDTAALGEYRQSLYQETVWDGAHTVHAHPGTEVDPASTMRHSLYIPYVAIGDSAAEPKFVPSDKPEHYKTTFMSGAHYALDYARVYPADYTGDYWLLQRSFILHNPRSIRLDWATRTNSSGIPFLQTSYQAGSQTQLREVTWSCYSNSASGLIEVDRGSIPSRYQITPVFLSKDQIHLAVSDVSAQGIQRGYDTVINLDYGSNRGLFNDKLYKVSCEVQLANTVYPITLSFTNGPSRGSEVMFGQNIAGIALTGIRSDTRTSRDDVGSLASVQYGLQIGVNYGWLTRERAVHNLPQVIVTIT